MKQSVDIWYSALAISPGFIVRNKVVELSLACLLLLGEKQEDGKYKHTVDLPKTTFELRANSVQRELELQKLWDDNQVLKRVSERNTGVSWYIQVCNFKYLIDLWIRFSCLFCLDDWLDYFCSPRCPSLC